MKEYLLEINVKWVQGGIEAKSLKEAKEKAQAIFVEEYNFTPTNKEIKEIKDKKRKK